MGSRKQVAVRGVPRKRSESGIQQSPRLALPGALYELAIAKNVMTTTTVGTRGRLFGGHDAEVSNSSGEFLPVLQDLLGVLLTPTRPNGFASFLQRRRVLGAVKPLNQPEQLSVAPQYFEPGVGATGH